MTSTADARLAAAAWVHEQTGRYPELVGAVVAGSALVREPEQPHPAGSDVDVFLFVDAEVPSDILDPRGRFAPRKLAFRGVVLEPSFHEVRHIADPEAVLGDMHMALVFANPCILLDPYGRLNALAAAVRSEVFRRHHAQRRLVQALAIAMPTGQLPSAPDTPALRAPCWRHAALAFSVARCAVAVLVAGLRHPTMRRSCVVAREVLRAAGREDLADELLRLLGSFSLSRVEVEALAAEAEQTYEVAVAARRTPVPLEWNVSTDARELERAAVREMIETGHYREALFQLLLVRTTVQGIIENDGDASARAMSRIGYQRLLSALGIDGEEPLRARWRAMQAFMPALREECETLLARAPGLVD